MGKDRVRFQIEPAEDELRVTAKLRLDEEGDVRLSLNGVDVGWIDGQGFKLLGIVDYDVFKLPPTMVAGTNALHRLRVHGRSPQES